MSNQQKKRPFPLLQLLMIVALILIVVAISTPNLLRSREATNAAARYGRLRSMSGIQQSDSANEERKLTKKLTLVILSDDPLQTRQKAEQVVRDLGGSLSASDTSESNEFQRTNIAFRIPANRIEEARVKLRELGKVDGEKLEVDDVTDRWVDQEASLHNLRAEEGQYLEIMKKAGNVKDTLEVAARLSDVRGRIEKLDAEFKLLNRQIEMSTIALGIQPIAHAQSWTPWWNLRRVAAEAKEDFGVYVDFMAEVLVKAPVFALWVLTFALASAPGWRFSRWAWRRVLKDLAGAGTPQTA
jgi:hypothetical protein